MVFDRPWLRKLARLPHFAALGIEAMLQIGLVWTAVRLLPARRWRRWLKQPSGQNAPPLQLARDLRRVIAFLAPILPRKTHCLICAIAARAMLARRGYVSTLSLGANASEPEITAHAWLSAASIIVTGREKMDAYQEVARF
jgi:hypothetical protein